MGSERRRLMNRSRWEGVGSVRDRTVSEARRTGQVYPGRIECRSQSAVMARRGSVTLGWRLCKWRRGTASNGRHQPFQDNSFDSVRRPAQNHREDEGITRLGERGRYPQLVFPCLRRRCIKKASSFPTVSRRARCRSTRRPMTNAARIVAAPFRKARRFTSAWTASW